MQKIIVFISLIVASFTEVFAQNSLYPPNLSRRPVLLQKQEAKKSLVAGKHISLNFQNISVRAVLQIIAEFTHLNIVVSKRVSGNITLSLNDIPWEQALDIILTTHGLEMHAANNVILIDTKTARRKLEASYIKNRQQAVLVRSELVQINYAKAIDIVALLKDGQNSMLSEQGKISADVRTNSIRSH